MSDTMSDTMSHTKSHTKSDTMTDTIGLERAVAIADRLRGAVLRRACASRRLRPIVIDRRRRLVVMQAGALLSAALLSLRAPLVSLWIGAALFGVPHVVAGFRAVALQGRATRVTRGCAAAGALLGVAQLAGAGDGALRAFVLLFATAVVWESLVARRHVVVSAAAVIATVVATLAALRAPQLAVVVLAHLHGLGALVYFGLAARRRRLPSWPLVVGVIALSTAAMTGLLDGAFAATLYAPRGAARSILAEALGAAFPRAAPVFFHRALFLYAFGQSLHFAVWLRLLPEVERAAPTSKTFRRALADLQRDFGRLAAPLLLVTGSAIVYLLVGGGRAREAYFALTYFHVGLEAAALARLGFSRAAHAPAPAATNAARLMGAAA